METKLEKAKDVLESLGQKPPLLVGLHDERLDLAPRDVAVAVRVKDVERGLGGRHGVERDVEVLREEVGPLAIPVRLVDIPGEVLSEGETERLSGSVLHWRRSFQGEDELGIGT